MTSRKPSLMAAQREAFIKEQIIAIHKALNKNEVPLKQKHVRMIIVGTHKEKSSSIFWNTISRIQLEKNPVITWKFCHILHKLIRDGHRKVIDETLQYIQRIVQLGSFWQHLHSSGYGLCNTSYCRMLVSRLNFHKRNGSLPGSLNLPESQINTLANADVNQSFELSVEMLDQLDDLISLQTTVCNAMEVVRWSSLVPQGQCLLAPLILVILDTSKFYDYLVKIIFKLHSQLPADALSGHRERFSGLFCKMKKFYEEASNLQYFKFLVSIPSLPSYAPNFLQASDLDTYQTPQAYLRGDNVSECDTPPDGHSIIDDSLVDISDLPTVEQENFLQQDAKDAVIENLRLEVEDARFNNERILNEARSRIEQYENRVVQLKLENDNNKHLMDEMKEELERLRLASITVERSVIEESRLEDIERKAQNSEQNFQKMKTAYSALRQEHINVLTKLSNTQKELEISNTERLNKIEILCALEKQILEMEKEKAQMEQNAKNAASDVHNLEVEITKQKINFDDQNKRLEELRESSAQNEEILKQNINKLEMKLDEIKCEKLVVEKESNLTSVALDGVRSSLAESEIEIDILKKKIETIEKDSRNQMDELRKQSALLLRDTQNHLFASLCKAFKNILQQSCDELQSAISISYPSQLSLPALRLVIESLDDLIQLIGEEISSALLYSLAVFGHATANIVVNCTAAAYTRSIQHFEPVQEQCRIVSADALHAFSYLQSLNLEYVKMEAFPKLKASLEYLEQLCMDVPVSNEYNKDAVGLELEAEMRRVDAAIQKAVTMIEEMQKTSRSKDSGIRLEVNEKILDCCNALMSAIVMLVKKSRGMQEEIIALGKGTASPSEYYKRNHQWTEGLISAAKAVGVAASVFVQCADGVITGKGKLEHLIVAAQEIAASTAQLYVSSRVKADRESQRFAELSAASRNVNSCTANVVAIVKNAQIKLSDSENLDFSHLKLHEAKKEEMESQVRTLELEAKLNKERARLAQLRKQHYHLASQVTNENGSSDSLKADIS